MITIYNAIQCLNCNDILWSKHRHDYLVCTCEKCMNDGGNDYSRGFVGQPSKNLSVTSDAPFEVIREYLHRYNRYSGGYVKLKDMSDKWLQNCIDYYKDQLFIGKNRTFQFWIEEKLYRAENEIFIHEEENFELDFK